MTQETAALLATTIVDQTCLTGSDKELGIKLLTEHYLTTSGGTGSETGGASAPLLEISNGAMKKKYSDSFSSGNFSEYYSTAAGSGFINLYQSKCGGVFFMGGY